MNSANFSVQSSLEANFLNIQLEEPINIDEIAMKTINNDCPDFLIPFQLLEVNGVIMHPEQVLEQVIIA